MFADLLIGGVLYAAVGALTYVDEVMATKDRFGYWPILPYDRKLLATCAAIWPLGWPMVCLAAEHRRPTAWRRSHPACFCIYWALLEGALLSMSFGLSMPWKWLVLPVGALGGFFSVSAIRRLHNKKGDPNGSRQAQAHHHLGAGGSAGQNAGLGPFASGAGTGAGAGLTGHPSAPPCPCAACTTYRNILAGVSMWGSSYRDTADVPTEHTRESVRAWKRARLRVDGGVLKFEGTGVQHAYSVEDSAIHAYGTPLVEHPSPDPDFGCHTCGFYAMSDRTMLPVLSREYVNSTLDLEVELSGTIIEHEKGYRAGKQRVLAVWVDRRCAICASPKYFESLPAGQYFYWNGTSFGKTPVAVGGGAKGEPDSPHSDPKFVQADGLRLTEGNYAVPSCRSCTPLGLVSLSEASGLLGTEIRWSER